MNGLSLNIAEDRLSHLRQLFPEVFREDQIDFDALKAILGEHVAPPTQERYGLSWAGKHDAYREIQKQTTATLTPDRANSINFDTSENIFIEGENLEVLRVLQKSYYGKVKMIYIDPPYNTGNDFIYQDNSSRNGDGEELENGSLNRETGKLNLNDHWRKIARENGKRHSLWLSMILPRIYLSRNLLTNDGVIFLSIDDNEVNNIKLLMNEIFGEENFMAQFIWHRRQNADNRNLNNVSNDHEYILCYGRTENSKLIGKLIDVDKYQNPDDDYRGRWASIDLSGLATKEQRPNLHFNIVNPQTGISYPPNPARGWSRSKENIEQMIKNKEIIFPKNPGGRPRQKKFLRDLGSLNTGFSTILSPQAVGYTTNGTKELTELLGNRIFPFPKPSQLVQELIKQVPGDDFIVLDFFAGAGTTAQAVINLNQIDEGKRKFLCVQLAEIFEASDEVSNKYQTIADISRARIRKVIEKQTQAQNGQLSFTVTEPLGFRAYKLTSTHFKIWQSDLSEPTDILEQLEIFQQPLTTGYQTEALLTELLLKAGYSLTVSVERQELASIPVYRINNGTTYMALEAISRPLIEALTAQQPQRVITLDKLFDQDNELLSNARLQLREAGIEFAVI